MSKTKTPSIRQALLAQRNPHCELRFISCRRNLKEYLAPWLLVLFGTSFCFSTPHDIRTISFEYGSVGHDHGASCRGAALPSNHRSSQPFAREVRTRKFGARDPRFGCLQLIQWLRGGNENDGDTPRDDVGDTENFKELRRAQLSGHASDGSQGTGVKEGDDDTDGQLLNSLEKEIGVEERSQSPTVENGERETLLGGLPQVLHHMLMHGSQTDPELDHERLREGDAANDERVRVQNIITERTLDYVQHVKECEAEAREILHKRDEHKQLSEGESADTAKLKKGKTEPSNLKPPQHPRKLVLHYVAPKIPAIRTSPDIMLRIRSARSDVDAGLAAYAIAAMAGVTDLYEESFLSDYQPRSRRLRKRGNSDSVSQAAETSETNGKNSNEKRDDGSGGDDSELESVAEAVMADRRFQQLVECVLCGVDVNQEMIEFKLLDEESKADEFKPNKEKLRKVTASPRDSRDGDSDHISHQHSEVHIPEDADPGSIISPAGLSVADAARAAWGLSILGYDLDDESSNIGEYSGKDIITALAMLCRRSLNARLQGLQTSASAGVADASLDRIQFEHHRSVVKSLAQDAAFAVWAFAGVKASSAISTDFLVETCCDVLINAVASHLGLGRSTDDIIDRLASTSEAESFVAPTTGVSSNHTLDDDEGGDDEDSHKFSSANAQHDATEESGNAVDQEAKKTNASGLIDLLGLKESSRLYWGLAVHGAPSRRGGKVETVCNQLSARFEEILESEVAVLDGFVNRTTARDYVNSSEPEHLNPNASMISDDSDSRTVDAPLSPLDKDRKLTLNLEHAVEAGEKVDVEDLPYTEVSEDLFREDDMPEMNAGISTSDEDEVRLADASEILRLEADKSRSEVAPSDEQVSEIPPRGTFGDIGKNHPPIGETDMRVASEDKEGQMKTAADRSNAKVAVVSRNDSSQSPPHDYDKGRHGTIGFSIRELYYLAWASTKLGRSSNHQIVFLVMEVLARLGRGPLVDIQPNEISTLGAAVSEAFKSAKTETQIRVFRIVASWITSISVSLLSEGGLLHGTNGFGLESKRAGFEPMELSQLMLSVASVTSAVPSPSQIDRDAAYDLSRLGNLVLDLTASHLPLFSVEDMGRIMYGIIELKEAVDERIAEAKLANLLGRMQADIAASLLRWEQGQFSNVGKRPVDQIRILRHIPLFGKSRFSLKVADHTLIDDDESESDLDSSRGLQRLKPALRDLPLDAATLCKVALGTAKLPHWREPLRIDGTILRVATRLFSSKQGHLLEECSQRDIVRLTHACALVASSERMQLSADDRDAILYQFPRRVVKLINDSARGRDGMIQPTSFLDLLNVVDLSKMLWSLGTLGVRSISVADETAHRRLKMAAKLPQFKRDELALLSPSLGVKLLCGQIMVGSTERDSSALLDTMATVGSQASMFTSNDVCLALFSLWHLTTTVAERQPRVVDPRVEETGTPPGVEDESEAADDGLPEVTTTARNSDEVGGAEVSSGGAEEETSLSQQTQRLFHAVLNRAAESVSAFTGAQLKTLLEWCVVHRIEEAQFLVEEIETEVVKRLTALDLAHARSGSSTPRSLVKTAAERVAEVANVISTSSGMRSNEEKEKTSSNRAWMSFLNFSSSRKTASENEGHPPNRQEKTELSEVLKEAVEAAFEASAMMERVERSSGLDNASSVLRRMENVSAFDLGRCSELIALYRRIDFEGGQHLANEDDMVSPRTRKRALSRFL